MPAEEALQQQAEEWKLKGNSAFANGDCAEAVQCYSQGLVVCDRTSATSSKDLLKCTLLSNRAAARLKMLSDLSEVVNDCTTALALCRNSKDEKLRCKLWYRSAKARFLLANQEEGEDASHTNHNSKNKNEHLQEAAKDLYHLLQTDPQNAEANQLMTMVVAQRKRIMGAQTPVSQTLQAIVEGGGSDGPQHHVKMLLGLLHNDVANVSMELGRLGGTSVLLTIAVGEDPKLSVLAVQCLSAAASHPVFVRNYLVNLQSAFAELSQTASTIDLNHPDLMVSILAVTDRILLHAERDDPNAEISGHTSINSTAVVQILTAALQRCQGSSVVYRAVLNVLSVWTAGTERESRIRVVTPHDLPPPVSQQDIRAFTPPQLAAYRKRQLECTTRDQAWAYERALHMVQTGLLQQLLQAAVSHCPDHIVRREMTVTVSRTLSCIVDDDKIKETVRPFLQTRAVADQEPRIEEVYNEDGDAEDEKEAEEVVSLETKMERALLTAALLLSNKECGAWALSSGWTDVDTELSDLIDSKNSAAMALAAEVLQAAAVVEAARSVVVHMVSSGSMAALLASADRDIRSGAAAAVAKLGLSEKSSDEGDLMGLLQAACELLEDQDDDTSSTDVTAITDALKKEKLHNEKSKKQQFSSFATSSVERAIEMIQYLVAHTTVKEELAAGFGGQKQRDGSALDLLVQAADLPAAGESVSGFGLATIFQLMAATNEQLRKEAFEGKEVTMEQYDEMQRMGKTEEEKEIMDQEKDMDTKAGCSERIRKMASANVPRALVALTEGASEHTLEQLTLAMSRMADEPSVRGLMIQQGVLSACIKEEKAEGPTETDVMKKVIRTARHCIAKMFITTNPGLLTSAQKLGSVRPLIQLVRDIKASDLQHFEALLALTNIGSSGEDAKNRIVTENGIPCFHFAMFSDHEMVRRAATEAMCNLIPHQSMMDHLAKGDNLRLWFAFAVDFEDNYDCARAATGCLAMASPDLAIAQEISKLTKFKEQLSALLESGRLEIMHRALVIVMNLVLVSPETRDKTVAAGLVEFCRAYIELQNHPQQNGVGELDFSEDERRLIPMTVEIAKRIVQSADE